MSITHRKDAFGVTPGGASMPQTRTHHRIYGPLERLQGEPVRVAHAPLKPPAAPLLVEAPAPTDGFTMTLRACRARGLDLRSISPATLRLFFTSGVAFAASEAMPSAERALWRNSVVWGFRGGAGLAAMAALICAACAVACMEPSAAKLRSSEATKLRSYEAPAPKHRSMPPVVLPPWPPGMMGPELPPTLIPASPPPMPWDAHTTYAEHVRAMLRFNSRTNGARRSE